ncbi:MAG: 4-hydroxy-tetrahydrodipicolinate reductase [Syntrophorhabdaceae bacterium]|nr:4-hydroxy-tetrahydrodipicolinate reductase [Syntrophorhabdaceae bacterium]MDD4196176.1 4-hydroxy-tetrahydrodipicolinate reductase [Syntrophorhabdaceae bacterium]
MVKIAITGACGKMGRAITKMALEDPDIEITGFVEMKGHPMIGQAHDLMGGSPPIITDDPREAMQGADVIVDFTEAKASLEFFKAANELKVADVIGTTALKDDEIRTIQEVKGARIVISPNMSIGMNILFDLAQRVSSLVGDAYDAEIVELHHRWKKDAPSGSALKIKDSVLAGQIGRQWTEVFGRQGIIGERKKDEIGIMSIRGGDIVGEHTLYFAGIGERLELTHKAWSRDNFAQGALTAAKWLVRQPPGIYSMKDVLGL